MVGDNNTGQSIPCPATGFVELPPLLAKTTALLNAPLLVGANETGRFVEPEGATLKTTFEVAFDGESSNVNGPALMDADPFSVAMPLFLMTDADCAHRIVNT